ncbi:MAG: Aspartyl-tRNA(Asn) amidotransferase subunit B [Hydrogenibacillus schlegelii]|uniref:Aspartyl/glutamyl-tRNA(Asn/Gln) amidotransferase subunit B n=1 Tax=Hydrogenibacillus schlegelii TaxID=1484 RepID=A0A2T5GCN4_HYDSH|nr:Asp-tRNA(Asn)/Glu-tRNA(Gln) amidotransferase subunit GatB [Hydrogenibacillus schlegelii]PTQ53944.1 MAG: Aspartyl-tRNA(Asn) amidotransferase subunit B [Hydrogenibacillus schlegelii]
MAYETVVGLEVHVELATKTKLFCSCRTDFGDEPNTNTCPICLAYPGTLPVLNEAAVALALKAALALNCEITRETKFDRKHYFYPDLPKAYQVSQFDRPLGRNGYVDIEVDGEKKRIRIERLHLEEDAGKLIHTPGGTLVDFNRGGVPLIEIVTAPDIRSGKEAAAFLTELRAILAYAGVSDVRMEEGSLRCDANVSVRPVGETRFGTKTEIKNMNSIGSVERAIEYEAARQMEVLAQGGTIVQETRRYDEARRVTVGMRAKETSADYRYFPDPDLVAFTIPEAWIEEIRESLPELPDARRKRYVEEFGLTSYDARVLTQEKAVGDFFEAAVAHGGDVKAIANWMMVEVLGYLNKEQKSIDAVPMTPAHLSRLVRLIEDGTISGRIAKEIFPEVIATGADPEALVREKGLVQIQDAALLEAVVERVLEANPKSVADYLAGKEKALGHLVGQVMKETKGKANPGLANALLKKALEARRGAGGA